MNLIQGPLTIVFYAADGAAAKLRGRQIIADKPNVARVYDVSAWDGSHDQCDFIEIMPDVPGWQRNRIEAVYGSQPADECEQHPINNVPVIPTDDPIPTSTDAGEVEKQAVHRGGGRWFVMQGEELVSGPHTRDEAKELAAK